MRHPFENREAGTSLVELIIAAGILAMIGYAATTFFQRVDSSDASARARSTALSEATTFLSYVERDFKLRNIETVTGSGACAGGAASCTEIKVTRKVYLTGDDYGDVDVVYKTECVAATGKGADKFKNDYSFSAGHLTDIGNQYNASKSVCIAKANCASGQYPRISIKLAGTIPPGMVRPKYPRFKGGNNGSASFPELGDVSLRKGPIGAAICGASDATASDRIVIEVGYVSAEGALRLDRREIAIPKTNVAKIQLLPNKE